MATQITLPLDRRLVELNDTVISRLWKECTPRILVVTDTLNFDATQGFGLSQFVSTLKTGLVHGMTPIVTTASRYGSAGADITGYDFNHATQGLLTGRWDVLFLFGAAQEGSDPLPPEQVKTIETFMHRGGGVFATGDHETLGAALCGDIGRVREMRKWKSADSPPHVSSTARHSTNLSGDDETEEFVDQSDVHPQRLYLNYRTTAGGTVGIDRAAHPLMQMVAPRRVLEVFPDHPHEGECVVPAALAGTMKNGDANVPQWPGDAAGADVRPEVVAYSVSHGDGFPTGPTGPKQGLVPKLFGAISAYDGHRAAVGRVATDATWHHFININLDGTGSSLTGLQSPAGTDTDALVRIRRYYLNLASWLMPQKVRRCLRYPLVLRELIRYPLFEELDLPRPPEPELPKLLAIGQTLQASLRTRLPRWEIDALADDALADALDAKTIARLAQGDGASAVSASAWRAAALGGLLQGVATELAEMRSAEDITPHKSFEASTARGARHALRLLLAQRRREFGEIERLEKALDSGA